MKFTARARAPVIAKMWKCPGCGAEIRTGFDGKLVSFMFGDKEFARCGGIYESATIICPNCDGEITFSKEELEVQP